MDTNPYAASQLPALAEQDALLDQLRRGEASCWRDGRLLVIRSDAKLPALCLRTTAPVSAEDFVPLTLAINKGLGSRWFTLNAPFSPAIKQQWVRGWIITVASCAVGALLFGIGVGVPLPCIALLGCGGFVVGAVMLTIYSPRLKIMHCVGNDFAWIKGVHPYYLATLPEWPAGDAWHQ